MVIASASSVDFNSLIRQCLLHRSQPHEFFSNVYQLALEHCGNEQQEQQLMEGNNGIGQQIVQLISQSSSLFCQVLLSY